MVVLCLCVCVCVCAYSMCIYVTESVCVTELNWKIYCIRESVVYHNENLQSYSVILFLVALTQMFGLHFFFKNGVLRK